jgi:fibronectin-binding autotransporter adhesin
MEVNLVLSGTNTFSGPLEIRRGSVYLAGAQAFPQGNKLLFNTLSGQIAKLFLLGNSITVSNLESIGSGTVLIANGNVNNNSRLTGGGGDPLPAATLTVNQTADTAFGGMLVDTNAEYDTGIPLGAGPLSLVKTGPGVLSLTGVSSYTGTTTIRGGALSVSSLANGGLNSGIGASGSDAGNLVLDGGTLRYTGAGDSTDRLFTLTGNGGGLDASGSGALTFTNTGAVAFSGAGAVTLTLTGSNAGDNVLALTVGNGSAATSLVKAGAGTWDLTGSNSYTGATTISGGILSVASLANGGTNSGIGAASSDAANLVLDGGTLRYTGAGASTDRLFTLTANGGTLDTSGSGALRFTSTGAVALSGTAAATLTLTGTNTGANTLAATLGDGSAATSLVKAGAGTWDLTGADAFTGATQVNAGRLLVDGSLTGTSGVTVAPGASLGGGGTIAAPVSAGGTLSPGNSPATTGRLSVGGLSFGSGGTLHVDLAGLIAGTGYDQIVAGGTVDLTGATLDLSLASGYVPASGDSFTIIANNGGSPVVGTFAGLAEGATVVVDGQMFTITYQGGASGSDVVLTKV